MNVKVMNSHIACSIASSDQDHSYSVGARLMESHSYLYVRAVLAHESALAEGQQQQLKMTSAVTSKFLWCRRASVL